MTATLLQSMATGPVEDASRPVKRNSASDLDLATRMRQTEERKVLPHAYEALGALQFARVVRREIDPEGVGIDVVRGDAGAEGTYVIDNSAAGKAADDGHLMSLLSGRATLELAGRDKLTFDATEYPVHMYVPPENCPAVWTFLASPQAMKLKHVYGKAAGTQLDIRNERYARASGRFTMTPQYVSRRVFCHGDKTILSKSGDPISWYRTTMFNTAGLPLCMDVTGQRESRLAAGGADPVLDRAVFRMSYDYGTEPNMCYDVRGEAQVRFAKHPYGDVNDWSQWYTLNSDQCYYLNEARDGPEVETWSEDGKEVPKRNRHEVFIKEGSVTLCCLFDPGCTGRETHRVGAYSCYVPQEIYPLPEYQQSLKDNQYLVDMMNALSLYHANHPELESLEGILAIKRHWDVYTEKLAEHYGKQQKALEDAPEGRAGMMRPFAMKADL